MCSRFDTITACDRQADGQTDRRKDGIAAASTVLAMQALRRAVKMSYLPSSINILTKTNLSIIIIRDKNATFTFPM